VEFKKFGAGSQEEINSPTNFVKSLGGFRRGIVERS